MNDVAPNVLVSLLNFSCLTSTLSPTDTAECLAPRLVSAYTFALPFCSVLRTGTSMSSNGFVEMSGSLFVILRFGNSFYWLFPVVAVTCSTYLHEVRYLRPPIH